MPLAVTRADIARIYPIIAPHIRRTPVVTVNGADFDLAPFSLTLKLEQLQHVGVFKTRGAFANLLTRHPPASGVVAASGGNHGAAVAYAAMKLGLPISHRVEVCLKDGVILRGNLRVGEVLLTLEKFDRNKMALQVDGVIFFYGEIESCVRLD
jgi:hypothetical protein